MSQLKPQFSILVLLPVICHTPPPIWMVDVLARVTMAVAASRNTLDSLLFAAAPECATFPLTVAADKLQKIVRCDRFCCRDRLITLITELPSVVQDIQRWSFQQQPISSLEISPERVLCRSFCCRGQFLGFDAPSSGPLAEYVKSQVRQVPQVSVPAEHEME